MFEFFKRMARQLSEFWAKIDLNHRLTVIFLVTLLIIGALSIIYYSSKPAFGPLYYGLDSESASSIKDYLDEEKIPYEIRDGGKAIYVPKDKVYPVRISLAGKGIPKKGQAIGYEIFDKTNLGMTEFVQKINYYRAVQGELARTISSVDGVDAARVHIVIPEESIFKEDQKETTASIVLQLRGQGILDSGQIAGIRQLVSSSVEGLKANNISIIDNWGNVLSQPSSGEDMVGDLASNQLGIRKAVENQYGKKIESLLASVLGNNNAVVRVNAELNFDRIEKTLETYNPESAVVRQETITSETSSGKSGTAEGPPGVQANIRGEQGANAGQQQQSNTNRETIKNVYEIDKTIQHIVQGVGDIKRITASVFIRQRTEKDEQGAVKPIPRSAEEMGAFEEIVKNALGFTEARGDRVSVKEIAFSTPEVSSAAAALEGAAKKNFIVSLVKSLLAGIAAILLVFFAISFLKKVKVEEVTIAPESLAGLEMTSAAAGAGGAAAEGLEQVSRRSFIESDIASVVDRQPEEASLIVKKWMGQ